MDFGELETAMGALYGEAGFPVFLVDQKLIVRWANREAVMQFPESASYPSVKSRIGKEALRALREGRTVLSGERIEPIGTASLRLVPVLSDGKLFAVQIFITTAEREIYWGMSDEKAITNFTNEYKMPLTIIFSTLGLMARRIGETEDTVMKAYLKLVTQNSYRLLRLSNNLTDYTKMRAGSNGIHLQNGDICRFIAGICEAAGILTAAIGIPLDYRVPEKSLLLAFDPSKLATVILNFVSNACKNTREGNEIKVKLDVMEKQVVVTISDKGTGIRQENIQKVFEPFFSCNRNDSLYGGLGLGLPIARYYILQHGGTVAINSKEGEGTTVAFTLPLRLKDGLPDYTAENSADYLSDRFSRLYVELSDVCGSPMP